MSIPSVAELLPPNQASFAKIGRVPEAIHRLDTAIASAYEGGEETAELDPTDLYRRNESDPPRSAFATCSS